MDTNSFVKHADRSTFEDIVLKADRPTLVDFWAPWCGPCRAIGPVLEDLARSYNGRVNVVKVNVDESPQVAQRYNVMSIPALLVFRDGQVRDTQVGFSSKEHLAAMIDKNLIWEGEQAMNDLLVFVLVLGGWFVLQAWVLPRFGVKTWMSDSCPVEDGKKEKKKNWQPGERRCSVPCLEKIVKVIESIRPHCY
jgi:thioredoxin 1